MKRAVAAAIALTGCAHVSSDLISTNPDRYLVECRHVGGCFHEAAVSCPDGFDVVDESGETRSVTKFGDTAIVRNSTTMIVQCRAATARR